jgi:hypothetical protein
MTPPVARAQWFDLPPSARDWITTEQASLWLPAVLSTADELNGWEVLTQWDALVGKLVREWQFGEGGRKVRADALAVAAVAEQLAVRLGARP